MAQLLKNNVSGVLASGIGSGDASITLVDASSFPSPTGGDYFLATLIGLNGNGQEASWEIVKVTAKASNTLTVVRAQESTTAASWSAGSSIQLRLTAGTFSEYATLASPTFTGTPAAPTAAVDTNTTQVATTAFVIGQGYLKSATATSTYQTISGMSSYLTTATASSTYLPLAGGTLTGKLSLPNVSTSAAPINIGNPGTADVPSSPVNGDVWINNNGLQYRQGTTTQTVAILGGTQTFTGATTFSATLTAQSNVNLGSNSGAATHNLGHGATTSGNTKTINIGPSGLSGSTTTINIGSNVSGAQSDVTAFGNFTAQANSGNSYASVNRSGATVEVGYRWQSAGANVWLNYLPASSDTLTWFASAAERMSLSSAGLLTLTGSLTFSGASRRVSADFTNATLASRTLFQSSTTNSETSIGAIPNGTSTTAAFAIFNNSTPTNSGYASLTINNTKTTLVSGAVGSGTALPLEINTAGTARVNYSIDGRIQSTGAQDGNIVAVAALNIDCLAGNYFTKTINGASTFTVSNVPASRAYAFTLELTHTSGAVTWFSGVQWPGGTAPTLTTGKVHLFTFVTDDGGTSWRGTSQINYNS